MPEGPPTDLPSADEVAQQVARWVDASAEAPIDRDAERLDTLLRDPRGLDFALGVVDRVIRPEDDHGAPAYATNRPRTYVYRRAGEPCRICGTPVLIAELEARKLYWCPVCQT